MTESSDAARATRNEIAALASPLRERLQSLLNEIGSRREELNDLMQAAREAQRVLDILEPKEKPPTKERVRKGAQPVHPQTLSNVQAWLLDHRERIDGNGGFSVPELLNKYGFNVCSRATLTHSMNQLHEIGFVRLDHSGSGGAKYWKLTS